MYQFIKRRYYDIRQAWGLVSPIFAFVNFLLIAYNFTKLRDVISIEYFSVIFSIGVGLCLLIIGRTYRKKQLPTDQNLIYERSTQNATTSRLQLEACKILLEKSNTSVPRELEERIQYLKNIELQKP